MEFRIEPATKADILRIAEIWHSGWQDGHAGLVPQALADLRTMNSFLERSESHLGKTEVARSGLAVLGFTMVQEDELYQMYVSPEARGTGVAGDLMASAECRILAGGYQTAWLACAVGNARAMRFYEKTGWKNTGEQPVEVETSEGAFSLNVIRYEKSLTS
jgi:GNAT superfamily N-acetyltransferase